MNKEQIILKVKEILNSKTNLTKISEDEYEGEVYVDYSDMYLESDMLKEYIQKGREYLEDDMTHWLCDYDTHEYDYILGVIKDNIGDDVYEEFYDDILDYINDNVHFSFPSDFVWGTEVPVNILVTAYDDWNYEFTHNTFQDGKLLDGGVKWLIQQQGYRVEDFEREVFHESEFSNTFFKSLYQEIIDTTSDLNALTVSIRMKLKDYFNLVEDFENKRLKELKISKYCDIGLVDFWLGAGGTLSIALDKDLVIPIENIYRIDYDKNFCYGISEIYGMDMNDHWTDVNFSMTIA